MILIPPLVFLMPFSTLARFLTGRDRSSTSVRDQACDEVVASWVDSMLLKLPWPWKRTCLKRSAVIYYLVRSAGRPTHLNFGVKRAPDGGLHAHAWLTLDSVPYLEPDLRSLEGLRSIAVFPD